MHAAFAVNVSVNSTTSINSTDANHSRLKIVASFYPIYEFVKRIGGININVTTLIPIGVEPHNFEPTIQQIQNAESADLIIYNGAGLEKWIDKIDSKFKIDASQGLNFLKGNDSESAGTYDPHVWLDPLLAEKEVENIRDALVKLDPANSQYYQSNAGNMAVTFRIPSTSVGELREESNVEQVSLNTLVNRILKNHLDWHRYSGQARLYQFPRSVMSRIIDKLTQEELSEVAVAAAKKDFVDLALLLRGEVTLSFFLYILEVWYRVSAIPFKHEVNDDVHKVIIEHGMGKNYSFFLKELYRNVLEMFETKSDFTISDNTVVFKFSMPD